MQGFLSYLRQTFGDESAQSTETEIRSDNEIEISLRAAKYLGRLSPDLRTAVVAICRKNAIANELLITEEMVKTAVDSAVQSYESSDDRRRAA